MRVLAIGGTQHLLEPRMPLHRRVQLVVVQAHRALQFMREPALEQTGAEPFALGRRNRRAAAFVPGQLQARHRGVRY